MKVERVVDDPKGEEKVSFLNLKRENKILQNLEGTFNDRRWEIRVGILTESKALRKSTNVETRNSLLLKEW